MIEPGRRGIALVAVLWIVLLLSVIALGFSLTTRTEVRIVTNVVENARARALAEAGVNVAILRLLDDDPEARWITDGRPYEIAFGTDQVAISIQDEHGKIDLNKGSPSLLDNLFRSAGLGPNESEDLVNAVRDWRDEDAAVRVGGAETGEYDAAGLPHGPKNGDFDHVGELQQVLGMTRQLFVRVEPVLTVHSGRSGVDTSTAPREALLAIPGSDVETVEKALDARRSGEPSAAGPPPGAPRDLLPRRALARGGVYTIRAVVRTAKGSEFARDAIVGLTGDVARPVVVYEWKQSAWREPAATPDR
jgi:general secretion pathway protein K